VQLTQVDLLRVTQTSKYLTDRCGILGKSGPFRSGGKRGNKLDPPVLAVFLKEQVHRPGVFGILGARQKQETSCLNIIAHGGQEPAVCFVECEIIAVAGKVATENLFRAPEFSCLDSILSALEVVTPCMGTHLAA
jgi:hypothetical protein